MTGRRAQGFPLLAALAALSVAAPAPGCGESSVPPPPPPPAQGPDGAPDAGDGGADADAVVLPPGPDGAAADGSADAPVGDGGEPPWFEDVTAAALGPLSREPADGDRSMAARIGGGVCVLDADGRAPLDLLFAWQRDAEGRGTGVRLMVAEAPWRYRDATAGTPFARATDVLGCLAFDADDDGDRDLLLTGIGWLQLYERTAEGFVARPDWLPEGGAEPDVLYTSAATLDVDGDGRTDLVVGAFTSRFPRPGERCPLDDCTTHVIAFDYHPNLVLLRGADGRFRPAPEATLGPMGRAEPTLALVGTDLDGDGRIELYVGNDLGLSFVDRLLRFEPGGAARDEGPELGVVLGTDGTGTCTMGVSVGDLDGDGRLDLVRSSFAWDRTDLFLCSEEDRCTERGYLMGIEPSSDFFRWAEGIGDLDLDGWPEVVEAAGHLYRRGELERRAFLPPGEAQRLQLFHNLGGERLLWVEPAEGDGLASAVVGRGLALADLDDDGRLDVVISPSKGRPLLLRNVRPPVGSWLRVRLVGPPGNRDGVGARLELRLPGRVLVREQRVGEGYLGSFDPRVHFGIPAGEEPLELRVRWPGGREQRLAAPGRDREIEVRWAPG